MPCAEFLIPVRPAAIHMGIERWVSTGSGRLFGRLRLRRQDRHGAAGLLDRGDSRFRGAPDGKVRLGLEFAHAKKPHPVTGAPQHPGFYQRRGIDCGAGIKLAGIDCSLHPAEVDLVEFELKWRVPEAALGKTTVERHLTALEALDAHA